MNRPTVKKPYKRRLFETASECEPFPVSEASDANELSELPPAKRSCHHDGSIHHAANEFGVSIEYDGSMSEHRRSDDDLRSIEGDWRSTSSLGSTVIMSSDYVPDDPNTSSLGMLKTESPQQRVYMWLIRNNFEL